MENPQTQNEPVQPQAPAGDSQTTAPQPDLPASGPPVPMPPPEKGKPKTILWVGLGLLVLAVTGIGAYYLIFRETTSTPSPTPVSTQAPTSTPDPTANWETYINSEYKFSFKYPTDFSIEEMSVPTNEYAQVIVNKDEVDEFTIKASMDYLPADVVYFLDTASTGEKVVGGNTWQTYLLPDGYGDEPGTQTSPIYGLQLEKNSVLYTITFSGQTETTSTQDQILSTFRFTEATPSATATP